MSKYRCKTCGDTFEKEGNASIHAVTTYPAHNVNPVE